jgi:hypothetical protein
MPPMPAKRLPNVGRSYTPHLSGVPLGHRPEVQQQQGGYRAGDDPEEPGEEGHAGVVVVGETRRA